MCEVNQLITMYRKEYYNVEEIGKVVGVGGVSGSDNRLCLDLPTVVLLETGEPANQAKTAYL